MAQMKKLAFDRKKPVKVPTFIVRGENTVADISRILDEQKIHCRNLLFLCDETTFKIGGKEIIESLKKKGVEIVKKFIQRSDEKTVRLVEKTIKYHKFDLLIGFGGGRILDVAKLAAGNNRIRYISIPTILSNDGISSPVSVITNKKGIPISHLTYPPYGVIIDYAIIKKAPLRHLRAGVGDLVSNLSAVFDCRLARKRKNECIDEKILRLSEIGAKKLLKVNAYDIKSKEFLETLCDGLLKSGLAMCLFGSSRPASGSEHKISHAMDYLFPGRDSLHGEQVGIATLFTMAIQKNPHLKSVKRLFKNIKFPYKLSYLKIRPDDFVKIVVYAKKIRPWRYTILEDKKMCPEKISKIIPEIF
ncbi:MAG: iron-containing alcohol dehydrogenase [candidate division WOR-3 bacterium]|nr:iron-containing alcohol dehydrogenase [candidate division WOR-3 bacterium]